MKLSTQSRAILKEIRQVSKGKRVVFVSGSFNVIHPGHTRLLRFAKEVGDFLVVGVLDRSSPSAFINENLRLEGIRSVSWVDRSFLLTDTLLEFIEALKPWCVVKGKEWEGKQNPEEPVILKYGGKLLFGSGEISFSSVDLIREEWNRLDLFTIKQPLDYLRRHKMEKHVFLEIVQRMKDLKICVIGDAIIDEYINCDPIGMSQEDPTIVVTPIHRETFIGGAGIVAAHACGLGATVSFFSVVGNDETGLLAEKKLASYGVASHLLRDESRPTTLKQRFRANQKTLLRVNHLRQHSIAPQFRELLWQKLLPNLSSAHLVIFSDFNYGCLPQSLIDRIVEYSTAKGIMMVADSQSSSQLGDVSRFKNMTLLTPTERETRIALHEPEAGLVILAEKLRKTSSAKNVIITLGSEGVLIHSGQPYEGHIATDQLPALNRAPKDTAGAGDSFLTCASMTLALGYDVWQASYLGSLASACQVGRIGNIPLSPDNLRLEIQAEDW